MICGRDISVLKVPDTEEAKTYQRKDLTINLFSPMQIMSFNDDVCSVLTF